MLLTEFPATGTVSVGLRYVRHSQKSAEIQSKCLPRPLILWTYTAQALEQPSGTPSILASRHFLHIPLEIRERIYELMLELPCHDHLNLLCVNRQTYHEARNSFYRRRLRIQSQDDLVGFVNQCPYSVVEKITNLQLRLEEVPPEYMEQYMVAMTSGDSVQTGRHPYLLEINRIMDALSMFSSLTHLEFLGPSTSQKNMPSSIVMTTVLGLVVEHHPRLQSLALGIEQCHIDCLKGFTGLKRLRLTGYSETSPAKTADVLSNLTSLQEVIIVGPPKGLLMRQRHGFQTSIGQSINHQVFERIRPLKRLTLCQITDEGTDTGIFLTSRLIKALFECHQRSLKALTVSSNTTPTIPFVEYLSAFLLEASNIRELSLMWPNMETTFVDCVPNFVQCLEFVVDSTDQVQSIVERLSLVRYRLKHLRHIKFHLNNPIHETSAQATEAQKSNPVAFSLPIQNLGA